MCCQCSANLYLTEYKALGKHEQVLDPWIQVIRSVVSLAYLLRVIIRSVASLLGTVQESLLLLASRAAASQGRRRQSLGSNPCLCVCAWVCVCVSVCVCACVCVCVRVSVRECGISWGFRVCIFIFGFWVLVMVGAYPFEFVRS